MKKISKRLRKIYIKEILIVMAMVIGVWAVQPNFEIVINRSESLPVHAVIIKKGKLPTKLDQIFVFKVKNNPHYKMKEMTFIKLAGGFEGDKIKAGEKEVYVDGKLIGEEKDVNLKAVATNSEIEWKYREVFVGDKLIGVAKTHSLKGAPLEIITSGVIPAHKFFAYTPHKDSFDSRYQDLGLVDEKDIIGTAIVAF
jgi:type IV secretory pathway protease TraF